MSLFDGSIAEEQQKEEEDRLGLIYLNCTDGLPLKYVTVWSEKHYFWQICYGTDIKMLHE